MAPYTLNLNTLDANKWLASGSGSFTAVDDSRYPLHGRLCGSQRQSGRFGEDRSCPAGNPTSVVLEA
jgi:hypothetical protein